MSGEGVRAVAVAITGTVQGVGFRPFVARLASGLSISGSVWNAGGGVHIHAAGTAEALDTFLRSLQTEAPPAAHIERLTVSETVWAEQAGFAILRSAPSGGPAMASPDIGLCDACVAEIRDPENRRYGHALNACAGCGPRYTILHALPYDRANTSMDAYRMCDACAAEYADPVDRRCHAQTVDCCDCGPQIAPDIRDAVSRIRSGEVLCMKGIGGYHLACSPHSTAAVSALRQIKARDHKPFAIMFRDLDAAQAVCHVSEQEAALLCSPVRPIVLLDKKEGSHFDPGVLCGDARCGAFLPYTALHQLLLDALGALVLTSANRGGGAIITDDADARAFAEEVGIRSVLRHPRQIVRPAEDSVAQVAAGQAQVIRRGRGHVPSAIAVPRGRSVLALGGDLKAAWCVAQEGRALLGPHMGDLEDAGVFARFREGIGDFCGLMRCEPESVACDLHPGYFSAEHARTLGLPLVLIQHHHAHIASVMAEHGLSGPVIGAAFDGTGYGLDGAVWGGEFLVLEGAAFERVAHLQSVDMVGGDAAARDARQMAYAYLREPELVGAEKARLMDAARMAGIGVARCSSMGRLFDAAAQVLGLGDENRYEGECAIALQRAAEAAPTAYPLHMDLDGGALLRMLWTLRARVDAGALALGFHAAVADMTARVCRGIADERGIETVALSGGVWQNRLLLTLAVERLRQKGLKVYWNQQVPPGDGGIALGQAFIACLRSDEGGPDVHRHSG